MFVWLFLASVCLAAIAWQDLKSRSVYWWLFLALFIFAVGSHIIWFGKSFNLSHLIANFCILLAVTSLAALSYIIRFGLAGIQKLRNSLGTGDLAMLPIFIYLFAPANMILFFLISFMIALTCHSILVVMSKREITIPMAAYWSILLWFCLIAQTFGIFNLKNDNWIYIWLTNC